MKIKKKRRSANRRFFLNIFALVLIVYGIAALRPVGVAAFLGETAPLLPLGIISATCIAAGFMIRHFTDMHSGEVRHRINFATTIITWLFILFISSVVYYFGCEGATLADSLFEATASLTTTGTGDLGISSVPVSLQLWHSILNWLGGAGLILIAACCLQSWSFSGHSLISAELPGNEYLQSSSSYRITYRNILKLYAALTMIQFVLLIIAGMPALTSVMTSLSNISTAGLQHINNGVITQLSMPVKVIITLFAFAGSLNLSFIVLLIIRKARSPILRSESFNYVLRLLIVSLFIAAMIAVSSRRDFFPVLGDSVMQTVSFLSTSGYIITDCVEWPLICKITIVFCGFIGACAVSTGGGIKTARVDIAARTVSFGLFLNIHPRAVRTIRSDNKFVRQDQILSANLYMALFMAVFIVGAFLLSFDIKEASIFDALNYSHAMITNTGTSICEVGVQSSAAQFSALSKIIMSLEMLCGRLEIYPVIMLFSRSFWRSEKRR